MSRSRDRRKRIAVKKAKREHAEVMAQRYYLTLVKRDCRCSACGRKLRARRKGGSDEMVYSRGGGAGSYGVGAAEARVSARSAVTLCVPCADADPNVSYRPSEAWERARWQGRKKLNPLLPVEPGDWTRKLERVERELA
jgi:hypothetical protein